MQPYPSYPQYRASFPSTMATVQPEVQPGPSTAAHTDNGYHRYDNQANEKDAKQAKNPSSSTLGKRWNDAEIRYLILAWKDHYQSLKGKKRTKQAWDEICRDFNASCKEQCVSKGYRTAEQAKNKMKTLIDEYKNVVDNNNRSGRDRITCPYFEDIDEVLGCKDSQSINNVVNAGNKEAVVSSGEEQNSECGDISFEEEEGVEDQPEKKTRKRKGKQQEVNGKRKKVEKDERMFEMFENFMEESQRRDHQLMKELAKMEMEREKKSQEIAFSMIKEITSLLKKD